MDRDIKLWRRALWLLLAIDLLAAIAFFRRHDWWTGGASVLWAFNLWMTICRMRAEQNWRDQARLLEAMLSRPLRTPRDAE